MVLYFFSSLVHILKIIILFNFIGFYKGKFVLNKDSSIYIKGITDEETEQIRWIAEFLKEKLSASTGFDFNILKGDKPKEGSILLTTINANPKQGIEGYTLLTTPKIIKITAYKPEGISRAIQTLRQMFPKEIYSDNVVNNIEWSVPASIINELYLFYILQLSLFAF